MHLRICTLGRESRTLDSFIPLYAGPFEPGCQGDRQALRPFNGLLAARRTRSSGPGRYPVPPCPLTVISLPALASGLHSAYDLLPAKPHGKEARGRYG